jgi:hypothetical protein
MSRRDSPVKEATLAQAIEQVARLDPQLVAAADDVDLGLLRWSLQQTPADRLRSCSRAAMTLADLRRAPSSRG